MISREVICVAKTSEDIASVKAIFLEYMHFIEDYLGESLNFQGTEKEFADFPNTYDALFLAKLDGAPVAACGLKPFKPGICELKRLYSRPAGRGHGFGEKLTRATIIDARKRGYEKIYLDTDAGLTHANRVYEELGFKDIERYYDNPMGCSRYMALTL
ncbi:GNAT family N-acetyltransferase [Hellea balneolensis]|uniref:GNAT family N-acetyltransferase n=1 Tax=Hellea balneolensis TaxID=287478 RepID=UPI00042971B2|nr:GNAT family N-acetyltransferase [Hellea balneolensis]